MSEKELKQRRENANAGDEIERRSLTGLLGSRDRDGNPPKNVGGKQESGDKISDGKASSKE